MAGDPAALTSKAQGPEGSSEGLGGLPCGDKTERVSGVGGSTGAPWGGDPPPTVPNPPGWGALTAKSQLAADPT